MYPVIMGMLQQPCSRHLAIWFAVLAIAARLVVPSGFMPERAGNHVVMAVCTSSGPLVTLVQVPGASTDTRDGSETIRPASPCSVSATDTSICSAVDPVLLTAALAFIIKTSIFHAVRSTVPAPPRLRPPLRGPPSTR